jgi:phosphotransferase system  glucose/maltose/N-acetylglucosamine-specific IIC component
MNETLSWRSLFILNLVALTLYFVVHIICAGVFFCLEPHMGWLGENITPHSYATYFYASFTYSQTICTHVLCVCVVCVSCVVCVVWLTVCAMKVSERTMRQRRRAVGRSSWCGSS